MRSGTSYHPPHPSSLSNKIQNVQLSLSFQLKNEYFLVEIRPKYCEFRCQCGRSVLNQATQIPTSGFCKLAGCIWGSVRQRGVHPSPEKMVLFLRGPEMTSERDLSNSGKSVELWMWEVLTFCAQLCFWLADPGQRNTLCI